MNFFNKFIESKLMPIASKIAGNRYLAALRDGFVFAIPFLIVGSFVLLLINLPFMDKSTPLYMEWYDNLINKYGNDWVQPFYATMGIMSLFVSYGIGSSLSRYYKLNETMGGFLSMFSFILLAAPFNWLTLGSDAFGMKKETVTLVLSGNYLGTSGLFVAIFGGFIAVEIYRLMVQKKMTIKLPDSVPPAIASSFEVLTPIIAIIVIFQPLSNFVFKSKGIYIPQLLMDLFAPLVKASDSLPAMLLALFLIHFLWFAGLHGSSIVLAMITPFMMQNLEMNQIALAAGKPIPTIFAVGFVEQFCYAGGAGATLGLTILMMFSKNDHLKSIGRLSVVPGIFNINESVMFGAPIVLNPVMFIPFITIPLINGAIAWFAAETGVINKVVTMVPWTTPAPIAALIASNIGIANLILSVALIALAMIIYWPFLKAYEAVLEKEEKLA